MKLALALLCASSLAYADTIDVCFAPVEKCAIVAVREIAAAKRSLRLQAYGFTSPVIEQALVDAHARGVDVQVILDRSNLTAKRGGLPLMIKAGIPTSIDSSEPIAHAKVMVIDDETVLCGSFNWTVQATRNSEDLVVIRDADVAEKFSANWQHHREHSKVAP